MSKPRVGIIGGGQLAWMMGPAADRLGVELIVQTPNASDPAVKVAADVVLAAIDDVTATAELADRCDLITFENEFVDLPELVKLSATGVKFFPSLDSLAPILDKYDQRSLLQQAGVPTPRFGKQEEIGNREQGTGNREDFGLPVVVKARRHGYDGQGTHVVRQEATLHQLLRSSDNWLIEEFVPFDRELAMMAARSRSGEVVLYPLVESQQEQQVCRRVFALPCDAAVVQQAEQIARTLLDRLNYVGVLGIEFFLTRDGKLLVNELAPRTHNSGHYTIDACETSQFEQQLRAVLDLPLGSPTLTHPGAVMVNLLGYETSEFDYAMQRQRLSEIPRARVYWYGKTSRSGRKLGHVTVLLNTTDRTAAESIAATIEQIWYP